MNWLCRLMSSTTPICFVCCTATQSTAVPTKPEIVPFHFSNESSNSWIAPTLSELAENSLPGPIWIPFVLGTSNHDVLDESSFFSGYRKFDGTLIAKPAPGNCTSFDNTTQPSVPFSSRVFSNKNVRINGGASGRRRIFFVFDKNQSDVKAIGVLDDQGGASCQLPRTTLTISFKTGTQRDEVPLPQEADQVNLHFAEEGRLDVIPDIHTGIEEGQIVRIGRLPRRNSTILTTSGHLTTPFPIDLYIKTQGPTANFDASEYLRTSILVGAQRLSVPLEPGYYAIVVIGKEGYPVCVYQTEIRSAEETQVVCPERIATPPNNAIKALASDEVDEHTLSFDATLFPDSTTTHSAWGHFMMAMKQSFIVPSLTGVITMEESNSPNDLTWFHISQMTQPSFASTIPGLRFFGPFAMLTQSEPQKLNYAARDTGYRLIDNSGILDFGIHGEQFLTRARYLHVPLAGTGETPLSRGATPFLARTIFKATGTGLISSCLATNGVTAEWLDLNQGSGESRLFVRPLQSRLRARVHIPLGNPSEYAELVINGKVRRRLVTPKSEQTRREWIIDERIEETSDFEASLMIWGRTFFAELITGTSGLIPMMITCPVCIDVNRNGECEARKYKQN